MNLYGYVRVRPGLGPKYGNQPLIVQQLGLAWRALHLSSNVLTQYLQIASDYHTTNGEHHGSPVLGMKSTPSKEQNSLTNLTTIHSTDPGPPPPPRCPAGGLTVIAVVGKHNDGNIGNRPDSYIGSEAQG